MPMDSCTWNLLEKIPLVKLMGVEFVDNFSAGHFLGGMFFRLSVYPNEPTKSLFVAFVIHLISELLEKNVHPITKKIETNINHFGDIVFFNLGFFVGHLLHPTFPNYLRPWLFLITMIFTVNEIVREQYLF